MSVDSAAIHLHLLIKHNIALNIVVVLQGVNLILYTLLPLLGFVYIYIYLLIASTHMQLSVHMCECKITNSHFIVRALIKIPDAFCFMHVYTSIYVSLCIFVHMRKIVWNRNQA